MEATFLTLILITILTWKAWRNRHVFFLWFGRISLIIVWDTVLTSKQIMQISAAMEPL